MWREPAAFATMKEGIIYLNFGVWLLYIPLPGTKPQGTQWGIFLSNHIQDRVIRQVLLEVGDRSEWTLDGQFKTSFQQVFLLCWVQKKKPDTQRNKVLLW